LTVVNTSEYTCVYYTHDSSKRMRIHMYIIHLTVVKISEYTCVYYTHDSSKHMRMHICILYI